MVVANIHHSNLHVLLTLSGILTAVKQVIHFRWFLIHFGETA